MTARGHRFPSRPLDLILVGLDWLTVHDIRRVGNSNTH